MRYVILVLWITEVFPDSNIPLVFTTAYEQEYDPELIEAYASGNRDKVISETGDDIVAVQSIKTELFLNNDSESDSANLVSKHFGLHDEELNSIPQLHQRLLSKRPPERENFLKHKTGIHKHQNLNKEVSKRKIQNVENNIANNTPKPVVSSSHRNLPKLRRLTEDQGNVHINKENVNFPNKRYFSDNRGGTINPHDNIIKLDHNFRDYFQIPNLAAKSNYDIYDNVPEKIFPPSFNSIIFPQLSPPLNHESLIYRHQFVKEQLTHPYLYLPDSHSNMPEHQLHSQFGSPNLYGIEHSSQPHLNIHSSYPHHQKRHLITYPHHHHHKYRFPYLNNHAVHSLLHSPVSHYHYHKPIAHNQVFNHIAHPQLNSYLSSYVAPFSTGHFVPSLYYHN